LHDFILHEKLDEHYCICYAGSHHDCSVTGHVSAIPKDAHIPRCVLPCCPDRLRSAKRTNGNTGGHFSGYELVLPGPATHACGYNFDGDARFLLNMTWILGTVWEAIALFLAVWIAVLHFHELPRPTRWAIGDCFTILVKTHVFYFASFSFVSFFAIINNSTPLSVEYGGFLQVTQIVQMFVLGPRLILGVREHHAKLVAHSDEGTGMASIVFQERIQITTGGGV